jgi:MFS family permease
MSTNQKRSYIAFIWHGIFLALTMAMLDLNTVFPTLIKVLTENNYIFGALYSIMLGVPLIFNIIFSHYLRKRPYKKPYLLLGIYIRSLAFLGMGLSTYFLSESYPNIVIGLFFLFIFLFSVSGGFAGISYTDLVAKTIPEEKRATFFSVKQFTGSLAGLSGGFIIARIFVLGIPYPENYTISLIIGFLGLVIASLLFYRVQEPRSIWDESNTTTLLDYIKEIPSIFKRDKSFRYYVIVENLSSFSVMILPFYIVYAKTDLMFDASVIGTFIIVQIIGSVFSNIIWGILGNRYTSKAVVRICILLGATNPILAILLGSFGPIGFSVVFFIIGFTISGRRIGFEPTLLSLTPDAKRMEYLGIRGTLNIFIVVLPLLGAFFINTIGFESTFIIVSIVMIIAAILLSKVTPEHYEQAECI